MNRLARLLLTASSIAPVCATLFFIGFVKETVWLMNYSLYVGLAREGANKQVISSQADSLIKISRIWADFFPANTSNQPI